MPKIIDLTDQVFGKLTVLRQDGFIARRKAWLCFCECGNQVTVRSEYLRCGDTKSCGCNLRKHQQLGSVRHGHGGKGKQSATYNSWRAMQERCRRQSHPQYKDYGGRGVSVCDKWRGNFEAFLGDMGERPDGRTLDRIDPNGNYEPSNCRWATRSEQAKNKRLKEN